MKYIIAGILLITWLILTTILTLSVIGWILIIDDNRDWFIWPEKLLQVFKT